VNKAAVMYKSTMKKGPVETKSKKRSIWIMKPCVIRISVIAVTEVKTQMKPGIGIVMIIGHRVPIS